MSHTARKYRRFNSRSGRRMTCLIIVDGEHNAILERLVPTFLLSSLFPPIVLYDFGRKIAAGDGPLDALLSTDRTKKHGPMILPPTTTP